MNKYGSTRYTDEQVEWILDNCKKLSKEITWSDLAKEFSSVFKKSKTGNAIRKVYNHYKDFSIPELEEVEETQREPKVLLYDIETAPMLGYVWKLWDNNVALNQIHTDWYVLSWSAKWLGSPEDEVMYMDQRDAKNIEDDTPLLSKIWELLNEADIVVTQNGKKFDDKKLNARFILNGFQPPSSFKHIDTYQIARKHFGFTSNKLEYMTGKLCTKYKKLTHGKFPGFLLWKECLNGNAEAWQEMEDYNRHDVLSLEELYTKMMPWDSTINFNVYDPEVDSTCKCGHDEFKKDGYYYTNAGKYQRYRCTSCGHETRGSENLLSKEKRKDMKRKLVR